MTDLPLVLVDGSRIASEEAFYDGALSQCDAAPLPGMAGALMRSMTPGSLAVSIDLCGAHLPPPSASGTSRPHHRTLSPFFDAVR